MRSRFEGKVTIITGAGQGIGRQVALDMASEAANWDSYWVNVTDYYTILRTEYAVQLR